MDIRALPYWKRKSAVPGHWEVEQLRRELAPFQFDATRAMSAQEQAYSRFYGLDLEVDHPGVRHRMGKLRLDRHDIAVHSYTQPEAKGSVFVFHGYFDHAGLYGQLFELCLDLGFNVVCWDQPGHGLSSGMPAAIGSFEEYQGILGDMLERARDLARPWVGIGQSTGGAILIDYLLSHGHTRASSDFQGVILLAPLVRPRGWVAGQALYSVLHPFLDTWQRVFSHNSSDQDFLAFLKESDPLQARAIDLSWVGALRRWIPRIEKAPPVDFPVTVVQGELDRTVAWRHNLRIIRNKFVRQREVRLPMGRHHLVNETPAVQRQVFAAIERTLGELAPE